MNDLQNTPTEHPYADLLRLPHPTSRKHPRMPMAARAAQFAPFAALTGHEEALRKAEASVR